MISAIRWYKPAEEKNEWHTAYIYEWHKGKVVATTGKFYSGVSKSTLTHSLSHIHTQAH